MMKKDTIVKNTCGVISLMLALLIVPFYAVAGILVEVTRYQSAKSGMDDAINASALSVLAQYDSFLQSRFGLLAMDQAGNPSIDNNFEETRNLSNAFERYLRKQDTTDTRSFTLKNISAAGVYPLADADILKAQIQEYSTLTIPTLLVSEFGSDGLQKMIKEIQNSIPGFKLLKLGSAVVDTTSKKIDVIQKMEKAQESVSALSVSTSEYNSAHKKFNDAIEELKNLLQNPPDENADEEARDRYQQQYDTALQNVEEAQREYRNSLQTEIRNVEALNENLIDAAQAQNEVLNGWVNIGREAVAAAEDLNHTSVTSSGDEIEITTLAGQIKAKEDALKQENISAADRAKIQSELTNLKNKQAELQTVSNAANAVANGSDFSQANDILKKYNTDSCGEALTGLTQELERVREMDFSQLEYAESPELEEFQSALHLTDMSELSDINSFSSLLKEMDKLNQEADSNVSIFSSIAEALSTIMSLSLTFDPKLQSIIDTDYYQQNFGGLPSGKVRENSAYSLESPYEQQDAALAQANLESIDFVNDMIDLAAWGNGVSAGSVGNVQETKSAATKLGKLLNTMSSMMEKVTSGANILSGLSNIGAEIGDHTYLVAYLNYMTTNRVDYASKKTMSGVSIKGTGGLAEEVANSKNNLTARFDAKETINYSFCGAETEYLLMGSSSEKSNQQAIFMLILALRVALDMNPVESNVEARSLCAGLAGALTLLGIPYKMGEIMARTFLVVAEAYVDAVLICNGSKDIPLVKASKDIHFCAKGLASLPGKLQKLVKLTEAEQKNLQDKVTQIEAGGIVLGGLASDGEGIGEIPDLSGSEGLYLGENKLCMTYSRTLLILMMIWNEKDLVNRFSDLIQMESTQKNIVNNASVSQKLSGDYPKFDLDKAYTTLRIHVDGNFVSVLPVPTLSQESIWKINRVIYRGY